MGEHKELKATLLTVSGSLLVWGIQMALQSNLIESGLAIGLAGVGFYAYEHVEFREHQEVIQSALQEFDDETLKRLIRDNADVLRDVLDDVDVDADDE